ncbi:MAG: ABC transporter ATP-binding protein, partial [Bacteroidales bacterium]|nr:ABC transporter ATP-binding protein [Bacteroidales bacterium]
QDVLLNASIEEITDKLYFDYGTEIHPGALYSEQLPGGFIQVYPNTTGKESKVNIEALFNTVHRHKDLLKDIFKA